MSCGPRSTLGMGKLGMEKLAPRIRTQPVWPQQAWHGNRRWRRNHELVMILAINRVSLLVPYVYKQGSQ
jgi:hypothetical protein